MRFVTLGKEKASGEEPAHTYEEGCQDKRQALPARKGVN